MNFDHSAPLPADPGPPREQPTLDPEALEQLVDDLGAEAVRELTGTFLRNAPDLLKTLDTGYGSMDWEPMHRASHTLKSNAALFGASRLNTLAFTVEQLARNRETDGLRKHIDEMIAEFSRVEEELRRRE